MLPHGRLPMRSLKERFFQTVHRAARGLNALFQKLPDRRQAGKVKYPVPDLLWMGVLMFVLKLGSRRRINYKFNTAEFRENLNRITDTVQERVANSGTLNDLLLQMPPESLATVPSQLVRHLLRQRKLEKGRLLGRWYLFVFDATGTYSFPERHCDHCLTQTDTIQTPDGKTAEKTTYYHLVLEVKLVTPSGLALSVLSDFIENPGPNPDVQDCELTAFYRLAPKLKALFQNLPICVLGDSLYGCGPVAELCQKYNWKYILTFKESRLPCVAREYQTLRKLLNNKNHLLHKEDKLQQEFWWVNDIDHDSRKLNILECQETRGKESHHFAWITNIWIAKPNAATLANEGGRQRWKIDNQGFNTQKNGGYALEHAYSRDPQAMKNYYLLLQLAHFLNQIMEYAHWLKPIIRKFYGSLRGFTEQLLEELRRSATTPNQYQAVLHDGFQIRLDTS